MIDFFVMTIHNVDGGFLKKSKTNLKFRLKNIRLRVFFMQCRQYYFYAVGP